MLITNHIKRTFKNTNYNMDRENLAKALFTHVKNNDAGSVEKCLSRGDVNSWREIIRFELELLPMLDNVLKDNKLIFNLIQCTIPCLSPLHLAALFGHNDVLITFLDKVCIINFKCLSVNCIVIITCL